MYVNETEIIKIIQEVVDNFLIPRFNELGMNATGEWLQSLEVVANNGQGIIKGRKYTEQLAKGRAGGSLPPIAPLTKWVTAKFGVQGKQATSIAWAVAKKIQRDGTTWHQKGGTDLIEMLSETNVLEFINERLKQTITVAVEEQLKRQLKEIFEQ
jgi:hypothetical protein